MTDEKRVYTIDTMCGAHWSDAVLNVIDILNEELGLDLFVFRDGNAIDTVCEKLGIRFDDDSNIVK